MFKRIINWTIWSLVALFLSIIVLLHVPAVQSVVGSKVGDALSQKLGTEVKVGRVDLGFLNRLIIDDVDIYDQKGKKMIHTSRLAVNISLYQLSKGKIAISSAQLFGLNGNFYQENAQAKPNFQFVLDSLASKDTTQHKPLDLRINSLIIRNGALSYHRHDLPLTRGRFNTKHLDIKDLSAHVMLHELTDSTIDLSVKRISMKELSGIDLKQLTFKLEANNQQAYLHEFKLRLPESIVESDSIITTYERKDGKISIPSIRFNGNLYSSSITPSDVKSLLPLFSSFKKPILLETSFSGTSTTLSVHDLLVKSIEDGFNLQANGSLSDSDAFRWNANIQNLNLSAKAIDFVSKNLQGKSLQLPEEVTRLGDVKFRGIVGGANKTISAKGMIDTDAGDAVVGVGLIGNKITGRIETQGLNLRRILANDDFGDIATSINVDGVLASHQKPQIKANGKISRLDYKSYTFNNITVNGELSKGVFDGLLDMKDTHGEINLQGQFNTSLQTPSANLQASIRNFNPAAMKLTDKWDGTTFNMDIKADFTGKSINIADGELDISNFSMKSDKNEFFVDHFTIQAGNRDGEHVVNLKSDFADMTLTGNYDLPSLPQSITNFIGSKLPTLPGLPRQTNSQKNNFTISATLNDGEWLNQFFDIPIRFDEPMYLFGKVNDSERKLNLECSAPALYYDGGRYEDARLSLATPNDTLFANIDVNKVMDNGQRFTWKVNANAVNNRLRALVGFNNNSRQRFMGKLDAEAQFEKNDQGKPVAHVNVNPSEFLVNDTVWQVRPSTITYSDHNLAVDRFVIEHNQQHLHINGRATKNATDSLIVDLRGINVNYITNLVNFHSVEFGGLATGKAYITSAFANPDASAQLRVDNFTFEEGRMGVLNANVDYNQKEKQIDIDAVAVDGPDIRTDINGYVSPARNSIDLDFQAHHTRLDFLNHFCGSFMNDINLFADGNLKLSGLLSNMNLTGMAVANGTANVTSLNTTYKLTNDTVYLVPNEIQFRGDTITDRQGNIGIVRGALHHEHLTNLSYDIGVEARNLLAYDFHDYDGSTFFGTVFATGNCTIHGKSGEVVIDVNVRPEKDSFIEYNASAPDAIGSQDFIEWRDATIVKDSLQRVSLNLVPNDEKETRVDIPTDIRLNFLIDCTPDATLRLLMDQASGDYIALNGSGTIRATFYNKGAFNMFGTYLVDHGVYKLTIQNVIKKDFQFQQGGTIVFGGDPYNAVLNLQANYTVNGVPLSDLQLGNSFSNNNIRVDCLMNITGSPYEPKVDFDLDLPTVSSDANQMVRSIINGQEEMNQQVIYLLSIGRFYVPETNNMGNGGVQQSQTSLAMQSLLSGTISQQINSVLGSVLKSNNWNFGANISTGNEGFNNAEYEGLLSGRLLNNRLLINGQFGYRDNANATTSFIGDFDIRYLLFPNGNLAIKAYNQTNDRYFTRNSLTTQGIGLIMKKDFNGLRDLFAPRRKKLVKE